MGEGKKSLYPMTLGSLSDLGWPSKSGLVSMRMEEMGTTGMNASYFHTAQEVSWRAVLIQSPLSNLSATVKARDSRWAGKSTKGLNTPKARCAERAIETQ